MPSPDLQSVAFADLVDRAHWDRAKRAYPPNGKFFRRTRGERAYWYYQGHADGRQYTSYVGREGDPAVDATVRDGNLANAEYRARRSTVATLLRAGHPRPDPVQARVVDALASAGVFEAGGVLVGTVAFQTMGGLVGRRLRGAALRTGDVDVAHGPDPLRVVTGTAPVDVAAALEGLGEGFRADLDPATGAVGRFVGPGVTVEFLVADTGRGSAGTMVPHPSLPNVAAQPLRHLEWLVEDPVRSILLAGPGVPVVVPDPRRFLVHKVLLSSLRRGGPKRDKDLEQAAALAVPLAASDPVGVGEAWNDATSRGPAWHRRLRSGAEGLDAEVRDLIDACARRAADLDGERPLPSPTDAVGPS